MKYSRFFKCLSIWAFITTPVELVGLPVLAVALLFVRKDAVQLPKALKWWDNYESYYLSHTDADLDGLAGPDYYIEREQLDLDSYWARWWNRLNWLGIRNPANYFQYVCIGAAIDEGEVISTTTLGDIDQVGGLELAWTEDGQYYEYYYVIPYTRFFKGKALRLRYGWKISSKYRPIQQFVFVVNPFFKLG